VSAATPRKLHINETCPRFNHCACNDCPLDSMAAMHGGTRHVLENEEPCRARRATREAIAAKHGLPAGFALLPHERDGDARRARWEALPLEEQEHRAAGLRRGPGPILTGVCEGTTTGRDDVPPDAPRSSGPVRSENPEREQRAAARSEGCSQTAPGRSLKVVSDGLPAPRSAGAEVDSLTAQHDSRSPSDASSTRREAA
jgi:hypothetical protein